MKRVILLSWLALVTPLAAAEYRAGSPGEAATLAKKAQPGDVIVLADGTYRSAEMVFDAQGTSDRPITLRAATPGHVLFSGASCLRMGGSHLVVEGLYFWSAFHPEGLIIFRHGPRHEAQHCRVTQCGVVDCNPAGEDPSTSWIVMFGTRNRVDHCVIQGKTNGGPALNVWIDPEQKEPNFHQIDHNYFGPRPALRNLTSGEVIRVGQGAAPSIAARIAVDANLFDRCAGGPDVINNGASQCAYRGNMFLRSTGSLALRSCHRCQVTDNYFVGVGVLQTGGVRVSGDDQAITGNYFNGLTGHEALAPLALMDGSARPQAGGYLPTRRCLVAGNVFVQCERTIIIGSPITSTRKSAGSHVAPQDCTFSENVVVATRAEVIRQASAAERLVFRGNFYSGGELGLPATPDAWAAVPIALGERGKLPWPQHPATRGPQAPPIAVTDIGPAWFSVQP